jgi:hypothetical protein
MNQQRRLMLGMAMTGGLCLGLRVKPAAAAANLSKAAVGYRDVPSAQGKVCAQCVYYIPRTGNAPLGSCKLVTGAINPGGWCDVWAPLGG